jgi:hypothetical protein
MDKFIFWADWDGAYVKRCKSDSEAATLIAKIKQKEALNKASLFSGFNGTHLIAVVNGTASFCVDAPTPEG